MEIDVSTMGQPGLSLRDAPRLIGLTGLAGSGKSEVAALLELLGYRRARFAGPLKAMLQELLRQGGVSSFELNRYTEGDLKEVPCAILGGRTPRHAMQTLGTQWGRHLIHPDLWVGAAMARVEAILAGGGRVVVEDVRFPNEAAAICGHELDHARGLREVWRVTGRGGIAGGHESETHALPADVTLDNSGALSELPAKVMAALLPRGVSTV